MRLISPRKLDMVCPCGAEVHWDAPVEVQGLADLYDSFQAIHKDCAKSPWRRASRAEQEPER